MSGGLDARRSPYIFFSGASLALSFDFFGNTTSSTSPYSFDSMAVRYRSRSVSFAIRSIGWPV